MKDIHRAEKFLHTVGTEGGGVPLQFLKRYMPTHRLNDLWDAVRAQTEFPVSATMEDDKMRKHLSRQPAQDQQLTSQKMDTTSEENIDALGDRKHIVYRERHRI